MEYSATFDKSNLSLNKIRYNLASPVKMSE